jgi:hypothetical protein
MSLSLKKILRDGIKREKDVTNGKDDVTVGKDTEDLWKSIRSTTKTVIDLMETMERPIDDVNARKLVDVIKPFIDQYDLNIDHVKDKTIVTSPNLRTHPILDYLGTLFYGQIPVVYWNDKDKIYQYTTYLTQKSLGGSQLKSYWNSDVIENGKLDKIAMDEIISKCPTKYLANFDSSGIIYLGVTTNKSGEEFFYIGQTTSTWSDRHVHTFRGDKITGHAKHMAIALIGYDHMKIWKRNPKSTDDWIQSETKLQKCDITYAKNPYGSTRFYLLYKASVNSHGVLSACEKYFMNFFKDRDDGRVPTMDELGIYDKPYTRDRVWKKKNIEFHCLNEQPESFESGREEYDLLVNLFGEVTDHDIESISSSPSSKKKTPSTTPKEKPNLRQKLIQSKGGDDDDDIGDDGSNNEEIKMFMKRCDEPEPTR